MNPAAKYHNMQPGRCYGAVFKGKKIAGYKIGDRFMPAVVARRLKDAGHIRYFPSKWWGELMPEDTADGLSSVSGGEG